MITYDVCEDCGGEGSVLCWQCDGSGCRSCRDGELTCEACHGRGEIEVEVDVDQLEDGDESDGDESPEQVEHVDEACPLCQGTGIGPRASRC